jgi:hypothetical protein
MRMSLLSLSVAALAIGACANDNPLRETALGISAAASVGRSAQLALNAVSGAQVASCVQVMQACTTYPCDGSAKVTLGSGCPLPLGGTASGTVMVNGRFTAAGTATLTATFTDVTAGAEAKPIAVATVTTISASQSGNIVEVKYTGTNAAARADVAAASVGASATWTVNVDTKGTAELGDDVLSIESSAASAAAGVGASAKVASLKNVVVDPSCPSNPTSGEGSITEVSGFIPSITKISFHTTCDGTGAVNGTAYPFDVTP